MYASVDLSFRNAIESIFESDRKTRAYAFRSFESAARRMTSERPVSATVVRPWNAYGLKSVLGRISGSLFVAKSGEATFCAYSAFGGLLRIDGEVVAVIPLRDRLAPEGWRRAVKLNLDEGLHEVEFLYVGDFRNVRAGISWVPPGERDGSAI